MKVPSAKFWIYCVYVMEYKPNTLWDIEYKPDNSRSGG